MGVLRGVVRTGGTEGCGRSSSDPAPQGREQIRTEQSGQRQQQCPAHGLGEHPHTGGQVSLPAERPLHENQFPKPLRESRRRPHRRPLRDPLHERYDDELAWWEERVVTAAPLMAR